MVRAGRSTTSISRSRGIPPPSRASTTAVSLANTLIDFAFPGRASHAAASPHLGTQRARCGRTDEVGVNYMREHMPRTRGCTAPSRAGGIAPNVVQAFAKVRYLIRARTCRNCALVARVKKIAEGAALMTETTMTHAVISGVSNLLGNTRWSGRCRTHRTPRTAAVRAADRAFAAAIQATLTTRTSGPRTALRLPVAPASRCATPSSRPEAARAPGGLDRCRRRQLGGADRADARRRLRDRHARPFLAIDRAGQAPAAHKGMEHAAKVMAATALDLILDPTLIAAAKADFRERLADTPFVNPIPDDVDPPLPPTGGEGH